MNYIKRYLRRNKLTREQLAKRAKCSVSLIDKIASGDRKLNVRIKEILELHLEIARLREQVKKLMERLEIK